MKEQEKKELLEIIEDGVVGGLAFRALDKLKAKIEAIPTDEPKTEESPLIDGLISHACDHAKRITDLEMKNAPNLSRFSSDTEREAFEQDDDGWVECEPKDATMVRIGDKEFEAFEGGQPDRTRIQLPSGSFNLLNGYLKELGATFHRKNPKPEPVVDLSPEEIVQRVKDWLEKPGSLEVIQETLKKAETLGLELSRRTQPPISEVK